MYFDRRLMGMTRGVRGRVVVAALLGLLGVPIAMWRLTLTGQAMARVFAGEPFEALTSMLILIAGLVVLRSVLQLMRDEVANATAARQKVKVRRLLYEQVLRLGAGHFDQRRSGDAALALVDGVEQLDQFFGQYLPQLVVAALTPPIIFIFMAFLDLHTATIFLVFALLTLVLPAVFHRLNSSASLAFRPLRDLVQMFHGSMLAVAATRGMYQLLDAVPEVQSPTQPVEHNQLKPRVQFDQVTFAYQAGRRPAVQKCSFELQPGQTLGV